jgi:beta propeller repeat protein
VPVDTTAVPVDAAEVTTPDADGDETSVAETAGETIPADATGETIAIGSAACCLTFDDGIAVWVDGDQLWSFREATGVTAPLALGPGKKKDPALAGTRLVWADFRSGDWDLWSVDLAGLEAGTATPALVYAGVGSQQTEPALDGGGSEARLVWVDTRAGAGARGAEIWTMRWADPGSARGLTSDSAEQGQPDVSGDLVVWSDYRNDPDAQYAIVADPMLNDADVYGYDLASELEIEVVVHPSKQLAPAIDGTNMVWLDWRGINPEPKYSEFQVYARRWPNGPERFIAFSNWTRPELWRRPAIDGELTLFAAEPLGGVQDFKTLLFAAHIDTGTPWLVAASRGVVDSVSLQADTAAWLGGGTFGRAAVTVPGAPGR